MKNDIQKSYGTLVAQFSAAIAGVELYAGPLTLSLVTSDAMNTSLAGLIAGEKATKQAKAELRERLQAFRTAKAIGRDYMFVARDVLKPHLGKQYSSAWDETGFVHSLSVPRNEDKLSAGLLSLEAYLTAHPEYENTPLQATAARAATVYNELVEARNAVNRQKTTWQLAMTARDLRAAQVRKQLRALIKELSVRLSPLDERWAAFGFNKPGAKVRPDAPTNVAVVSVAENAVAVQWDKSPGAEYYRVSIKVVGVDEEPKVVGTPADTDFMFEELPANADVEVTISAVNKGGESGLSEVVRLRSGAGGDGRP
ncbi:MAG: fibronectin type III domain-containing protein [Verrucomicrobia bacterium]|nr:fibronectin type III domain-containing protein [Verrucomicrobiota bacterium]